MFRILTSALLIQGAFLTIALNGLSSPVPAQAQSESLTQSSVLELADKKGAYSRSGFSWIPKSHTIVYSAVNDVREGSWIYEISVPSGVAQKLFQGERPFPSPDGRQIAFFRAGVMLPGDKVNAYNTGRQIWVADIDGSNMRQLTHAERGVDDLTPLVWSPDIRRILYFAFAFDFHPAPTAAAPDAATVDVFPRSQTAPYAFDLRTIDLSNGEDSVVVHHDGEMGMNFAWLDANTILYEADNNATAERDRTGLSTISLDDKHTTSVLTGYQWQSVYSPAVNVRSGLVAFRADPEQQSAYPSRMEIGIANLRSHAVKLSPFTRNAVETRSSMSWTPDGKWLFYSDGPSTRFELNATDGTQHRMLTFGDGKNYDQTVSDDGKYIAWVYQNDAGTTWLQAGEWADGAIAASRKLLLLTDPLAGIAAGKTTAERWKSFDGTIIDGYLTLPVSGGNGPYPLVVVLHGGPTGQNTMDDGAWPGGMYFIEFLAQHGYAVFQPDYRGSGNFGYDFILQERAKRDLFKEDFGDISAGIAMLEKRGIADPSKLYLLGHSYGSMEVNWIITHDTRFRAAISYEGGDFFYDWSSPAGVGRAAAGPNKSDEWRMSSTPLTQPAAWAANSAVLSAARATTPTLFINTEFGGIFASMAWLSGALQSKGVNTQFLFYRGEPHVVAQPKNQLDLFSRALQWIESH